MTYSEEQLKEISDKFIEVSNSVKLLALTNQLFTFGDRLKNKDSHKYIVQGVGSRLMRMNRCIENIFALFPPSRRENLSMDERIDVDINFHAFLINVAGVFDNMAWGFVYEKGLEGNVYISNVDLFKKETQQHLPLPLREYLSSDRMVSWHKGYSKVYRDSLAHRIPPYLPPFVLEQSRESNFRKLHKQLSELRVEDSSYWNQYEKLLSQSINLGVPSIVIYNEEGNPIYFHGEILVDYLTVEEVVNKFCKHFFD